MDNTCYQVNRSDIVYETFGKEVIVLNLSSGHYYSLENSAAELWQMLEKNLGVKNIVSQVSSKYKGFTGNIEDAVNGFIEELLKENIIEIGTDRIPSSEVSTLAVTSFGAVSFEVPVLHKFMDLPQYFLTA